MAEPHGPAFAEKMSGISARKQPSKLIAAVVILFAVISLTRLLTVSQPLLGNFVSRQVPYAMAAEEYLKGAKLFYPQTYDLVNGKPTIMLLDFPLISVMAAGLHTVTHLPVDASGRLVSAFASLLSAVILVLLVRKLWGAAAAILALAGYSFSPLGILYGQSFQADALSSFFGLFALYAAVKAGDGKNEKIWTVIAGLAYGTALATRIHAGVLLLPITVLFFCRGGMKALLSANYFLFLVTAFLLPVPWYAHTFYAATHIDNIIWSNFHQSEVHGFPNPLLFKWEFYKQLAKLLMAYLWTPAGFLLLFPGLFLVFKRRERNDFFLLAWFAAVLAPIVLLPRKIFDHNYYLLPAILPGICLIALSAESFLRSLNGRKKTAVSVCVYFICLSAGLAIAWKPVWTVPAEEQNILSAAKKVRELTPVGSKILFHGGPAFTYYSNRYGWTFNLNRKKLSIWLEENVGEFKSEAEMAEMSEAAKNPMTWLEYLKKREGAAYFASSNAGEMTLYPQFYQYLTANYKLLYQDEKTLIFEL